jgi:DNA-directed RNA polymerase specialized sigma24 family protein
MLSVMDSDAELVHRLRSGDERAFTGLVERNQQPMLQLAASFVPNLAVAEEVVQDTWLAVLSLTEGNQRVLLHRGRSRLRQLLEDGFREVR